MATPARRSRKIKEAESTENDALEENYLAKKLAPRKDKGGIVLFKGYIGKSDSGETIRLFLNLIFNEYIDIRKDDIIHTEKAPSSDLPFDGVYLWVNKYTEVTYGRTEALKKQAEFLKGEIVRRRLMLRMPPSRFVEQARIGARPSILIPCGPSDPPCPASDIGCTPDTCQASICTGGCPSIGGPCETDFFCTQRPEECTVLCPSVGTWGCKTAELSNQISELINQMKEQKEQLKRLTKKGDKTVT